MPSARLPDPGTPAYQATADQYAAAQRDATRQAAALLHSGALLVAPDGPWAARMLDSVRAGQSRRMVCKHLADANGPKPMYVVAPRTLVCPDCLDSAIATLAQHLPGCAACGRAGPGPLPHRIHIAQAQITLIWGRLCLSCGARERRPEGP